MREYIISSSFTPDAPAFNGKIPEYWASKKKDLKIAEQAIQNDAELKFVLFDENNEKHIFCGKPKSVYYNRTPISMFPKEHFSYSKDQNKFVPNRVVISLEAPIKEV